jgi:hypothetical protein
MPTRQSGTAQTGTCFPEGCFEWRRPKGHAGSFAARGPGHPRRPGAFYAFLLTRLQAAVKLYKLL